MDDHACNVEQCSDEPDAHKTEQGREARAHEQRTGSDQQEAGNVERDVDVLLIALFLAGSCCLRSLSNYRRLSGQDSRLLLPDWLLREGLLREGLPGCRSVERAVAGRAIAARAAGKAVSAAAQGCGRPPPVVRAGPGKEGGTSALGAVQDCKRQTESTMGL